MARKKIKEMELCDQPQEKLLKYGCSRLSNAELLAIIIRTGTRGEGAVDLARKVLNKLEIKNYLDISSDLISQIPGLGKAKSSQIIACLELGKRIFTGKKHRLYATPQDIWQEMRDLRSHRKEYFVAFFLDSRSQEIERKIISVGSIDKTLVHPREVFEPAIRYAAAHIIVAHNHPSGDAEPSDIDMLVTKRLADSGKLLGIELVDHVIVTKDSYISLKARGLLK